MGATLPLLALAAALIEVRAEDLSRFHLQAPELESPAPPAPPEPAEPAEPLEPSEPRLFRLLGYLAYAASGAFFGSQEYRDSQSGSWEPTPDNAMVQVGAIGAGTEALNWTSSRLYRGGMHGQAWALRIGQIATFSAAAAYNFERGWQRR